MNIIGGDFLKSALETEGYFFKGLLNDSVAYFFPATIEHKDAAQPGLRYLDDSQGNALALTITPQRIAIRFHRNFSDERIQELVMRLMSQAEVQPLAGAVVTYQGRTLVY